MDLFQEKYGLQHDGVPSKDAPQPLKDYKPYHVKFGFTDLAKLEDQLAPPHDFVLRPQTPPRSRVHTSDPFDSQVVGKTNVAFWTPEFG